MKEGRAGAVKLEGGRNMCGQIRAIVDASMPVVAHLGMTPQSVNTLGGFRVQARTLEAARQLLDDARAVEEAGAFAVVLECVPAKLAAFISSHLQIPTIGIGGGSGCDGQVLVYQDMLGMFSDYRPKFVRQFANVGSVMQEAFAHYKEEVQAGSFPADAESFTIADEIIETLAKEDAQA
jgi:3-methyl-2-oxobutanoate hydroxymethyltransferase